MEISAVIHSHIKSKDGNCKVYPSPFAVNLNADDKIWVEPDISIICDTSRIDSQGCKGRPSLDYRGGFPQQHPDGLFRETIQIPHRWCSGILDCQPNEKSCSNLCF